jgi:hypothetical protein
VRGRAEIQAAPDRGVCPYKVYLMLGLHTSFHHSWRGDTPDEAGFGTDIRCVRAILRLLEEAAAEGLPARVYWDFDVYWTLQRIIPFHAPDIIEAVRRRVVAGLDEIVPGYYNNGANHAATPRELRAALAWSRENPFGSGLGQLFGDLTDLLRPQESMYTAGQNALFREAGVSGLVLYYSAVPFNALSTFLPALPPQQRYGLLRLRARPEEPPVELWPCISPGDLLEHTCLEGLLLSLRRLQRSGRVRSDLLVHVNFDADSDTWLPVKLPRAFAWFPNTGGLQEYLRVVAKYPWAELTVPGEYRRTHEPVGEVLVRQDLADGGFDGNYSWAEKHGSLLNWSALERSRLHSYRAEALAGRLPLAAAKELRRRLWGMPEPAVATAGDGAGGPATPDAPAATDRVSGLSPFFLRLVGLTTTHFGMSTPVINEERQAKGARLLGAAAEAAAALEREAALALRRTTPAQGASAVEALYELELFGPAAEVGDPAGATLSLLRLPVILPAGVEGVRLERVGGERAEAVPVSLVETVPLPEGGLRGELIFLGEASGRYRLLPGSPNRRRAAGGQRRLRSGSLELELREQSGVGCFSFRGERIGGKDFLRPFVTYRSRLRPRHWRASSYTFEELPGESWDGLARARLRTSVPMATPGGRVYTELRYTFTLLEGFPGLLLDVEVRFAGTAARRLIRNVQQKLRRPLDLRWLEVAPCNLDLALTAPAERPFRVWKHNHLGVSSSYALDYGRHNPRNRQLHSFNHQVTAGWVAVSNGRFGLLLAESAERLCSMAFCPMRLRERRGEQRLSLNPFGSYFGRQLDYGHLGGNRIGAALYAAVSGSLRPNGPSFNGRTMRFSLLLAPYEGDEPPPELRAAAGCFFYPPGVILHRTPAGVEAVLPEELRQHGQGSAPVEEEETPSREEPPGPRAPEAAPTPLASAVTLSALWPVVRLVGASLLFALGVRLRRPQR